MSNGYFQLDLRDEGTYLRIIPPKDGGEAVNVNEIMEYLLKKGISAEITFINQQILKCQNNGGEFRLDRVKRYQEREMLVPTINWNKMEVSVRFYPPSVNGTTLSKEEIIGDLGNAKVVYGIDMDAIERFLAHRVYCENLIFARGKEPRHGWDATIQYFFETDLRARPTLNEDGSVDFFQLNTMNHIKKGDLLAKLTPEDKGENGVNVCGESMRPRDVKHLSLKYGRNITISEDRTELYSNVDGHVVLVDDKVFVSDIYEVENVDNATGNIEYDGNVQVNGNVCSNFKIKAHGNVEVRGVVEGAMIEADGNITIARGVNGMGKGYLKAGGNVIAKFIENATVFSGGYVETESILHSKVMARTEVNVVSKKGFITGGVVCATNAVNVKTLGSPMGADTSIELGLDPSLKIRFQELRTQMEQSQKSLRQMQPVLTAASQKMAQGIKISPEQVKYIQSLALACQQLQDELASNQREYKELEELMSADTVAQVTVKGTVYVGTKIAISDVSMVVKDNYQYCKFIKIRGEIKMTAL